MKNVNNPTSDGRESFKEFGDALKEFAERFIAKQVRSESKDFFVRIAGISGIIAMLLDAYGSHIFRNQIDEDDTDLIDSSDLKYVFKIGNRYHFVSTLCLLATPGMRHPYLSGFLMTTGMTIFCGSCYYHALTGKTKYNWLTPYGGVTLLIAWFSMAL
ncbi:DgyrCDS12768 [Dimorphilus gyrociliatus]|uniref:DgyrCDS12768 n=1 Tax=Dimorphilus gyrociliatus TaxID=2664684 RepID=A0A7I8W8P0_9ANNE|nr:DgyrCDS12768 [Dimorphilus gyrociliatus]